MLSPICFAFSTSFIPSAFSRMNAFLFFLCGMPLPHPFSGRPVALGLLVEAAHHLAGEVRAFAAAGDPPAPTAAHRRAGILRGPHGFPAAGAGPRGIIPADAAVYAAEANHLIDFSHRFSMAPTGQASMQVPQRRHWVWSITQGTSSVEMQPPGQASAQVPQPMQASVMK